MTIIRPVTGYLRREYALEDARRWDVASGPLCVLEYQYGGATRYAVGSREAYRRPYWLPDGTYEATDAAQNAQSAAALDNILRDMAQAVRS